MNNCLDIKNSEEFIQNCLDIKNIKEFISTLKKWEKQGLITITIYVINGKKLYVANYTEKQNSIPPSKWPALMFYLRGLVYDDTSILAVPMMKFWKPEATEKKIPEDGVVTVAKKIDGSCIYFMNHREYGLLVWTRKALFSRQAKLAVPFLKGTASFAVPFKKGKKIPFGIVYGCELIHPADQKVELLRVQQPGVYIFWTSSKSDYKEEAKKIGIPFIEETKMKYSEFLKILEANDKKTQDSFKYLREGYVISFDGVKYKIKTLSYLLYLQMGIQLTRSWIMSQLKRWNQVGNFKSYLRFFLSEKISYPLRLEKFQQLDGIKESILRYFDTIYQTLISNNYEKISHAISIASGIIMEDDSGDNLYQYLIRNGYDKNDIINKIGKNIREIGSYLPILEKITIFGENQPFVICNLKKLLKNSNYNFFNKIANTIANGDYYQYINCFKTIGHENMKYIDGKEYSQYSLLMIAVSSDTPSLDIIKHLVEVVGVNINYSNGDGNALEIALNNKASKDVIQYLKAIYG